jgi:hypothetical protein
MRDRVSAGNTLVLASTGSLSGPRVVVAAGRALPPVLGSLADSVAARLGPALRGGSVYTDDRAPVEWLTDLSLLQYATGTR